MRSLARLLMLGLLVAIPACSDDDPAGPDDPITGTWAGEFDNGIPIDVTLSLSGTAITGTFDTGDSQGTVSGTYPTFGIQFTATNGTQRTLANTVLTNAGTRITGDWDDGAGQSGAFCLAKEGSTACP